MTRETKSEREQAQLIARRAYLNQQTKIAIEKSDLDADLAQQLIKTIDGHPIDPVWGFKLVQFALNKAANHLDYTGYGDRWERECAEAQGLYELIELAQAVTIKEQS